VETNKIRHHDAYKGTTQLLFKGLVGILLEIQKYMADCNQLGLPTKV
jgi:hypothetical protein